MTSNKPQGFLFAIVAVCWCALAVGIVAAPSRVHFQRDETQYTRALPVVATLEVATDPAPSVQVEGTDVLIVCAHGPNRIQRERYSCSVSSRASGLTATVFDLNEYTNSLIIRRDVARGLVVVTDYYGSPFATVRVADVSTADLTAILGYTSRSTLPFRLGGLAALVLVLAALPRRQRLARRLDPASLRFGQIDARGVLHLDDGGSIQLPASQQFLGQRVVVHHVPTLQTHYREDPTQPREEVRLDPADWYLQTPRSDLAHHDFVALGVLVTAAASWIFVAG